MHELTCTRAETEGDIVSFRSDTIATMVLKRVNQNHFLPAIQREFVWQPHQISALFDSIMRGYPISSFLLWELDPELKTSGMPTSFSRSDSTPRISQ